MNELSRNPGELVTPYWSHGENGGTGKWLVAVTCATLCACQTPATRIETKEVLVPTAVQPIKPEQVPATVSPLGPRPKSLSAAADTLLSKWCAAVAYMLKADPLLRIAAGEKPIDLAKYPECGDR
jgi:hypothetical protein